MIFPWSGSTPMAMASFRGHSAIVTELVKAGAWVNTLSTMHPGTYSPLMFAATEGRHYVIPDDVKALAEPVLAHRLGLDPESEFDGVTPSAVISEVLVETPPPSERIAV